MKPKKPSARIHNAIKVSIISLFLLSSLALKSQSPTDFSGRWEFDKAMSDKEERGDASFNGTIILEIKQNATTIIFTSTYIRAGKEDYIMKPDTYFVDGKVTTDNSGTGPANKFAKWSQDKKILTTSLVMTDSIDGVAQEFLTAYTYKLSDDRKTLLIEEFHKSKLNGEQKIKKVYKHLG
jgi:hypothetical protein